MEDEGGLASFRATHPRAPVNLLVIRVRTLKEVPVARLVIETSIDTIDIDPREKLRLYRKLLEINRLPLAKFYLYGDEKTVGVAVDLDLRSLSKDEFNDALMTLLLAYLYLKSLGPWIKDRLREEETAVLAVLVKRYMEKGWSRDDIIEYLVGSGLDRRTAQDIVATIYGLASKGDRVGLFM